MHKQRNKRGKLSRSTFTQTIIEPRELKVEGQEKKAPNPRYPGTKTIIHGLTNGRGR